MLTNQNIFVKLHAEGTATVSAATQAGSPSYTFTAGSATIDFAPLIGLPHITLVDQTSTAPSTVSDLNIWPVITSLDANNHFYQFKIYNCALVSKTVKYRVWRYVY
jgi:hypothetical protein